MMARRAKFAMSVSALEGRVTPTDLVQAVPYQPAYYYDPMQVPSPPIPPPPPVPGPVPPDPWLPQPSPVPPSGPGLVLAD